MGELNGCQEFTTLPGRVVMMLIIMMIVMSIVMMMIDDHGSDYDGDALANENKF